MAETKQEAYEIEGGITPRLEASTESKGVCVWCGYSGGMGDEWASRRALADNKGSCLWGRVVLLVLGGSSLLAVSNRDRIHA